MHALFAATSSSSGSAAGLILPLLLFGGVFYFLLIRPQQRRARAQKNLANELVIGDEVLTIGGIYGIVKDVEDDSVMVEIAPGTNVRMLKGAINRRIGEDEEEFEEEPEEEPDTST
ncbi:MAG: preprotein translocase subunit YajC [Actinomycetota bacterium]